MDARQINLSRYSLLFPEKRAFFLENAGVFSFASTGPPAAGGIPATGADVYPFFSRHIGLLGGEEVPIDVGVKLTGTVGRTDIGVLGVRTGDLPVVEEKPSSWHASNGTSCSSPTRAPSSRTGARHPGVGPDVRRGPAPGDVALPGRVAQLRRQRLRGAQRERGTQRPRLVLRVLGEYPNDKFAAQIAVRDMQENFRPALGFVQRDNVRMLRMAASYNPRPKNFLNIQQMFHDVYYTQFTRLDNEQVESWDLYITPLDWHLKSGDNFHSLFDINPTYERLFEPFKISPGVVLPRRRVPLHALPEQPVLHRGQAPAVRQLGRGVGQLLVGRGRAGHREPHLQAAALAHVEHQHESDVREAAGGPLHGEDLHART